MEVLERRLEKRDLPNVQNVGFAQTNRCNLKYVHQTSAQLKINEPIFNRLAPVCLLYWVHFSVHDSLAPETCGCRCIIAEFVHPMTFKNDTALSPNSKKAVEMGTGVHICESGKVLDMSSYE